LPPTQNTAPSITTDGTPEVGETVTGNLGSYVGTPIAQFFLLDGSPVAATSTYQLSTPGSVVFQVNVRGPANGVTPGSVQSFYSSPITVADTATPPPTANVAAYWSAMQ
jgi:hypothetical protein